MESKTCGYNRKRRLHNPLMPLWNRLRAAREKSGLSQEAVGKLFDPPISRAAVAQWEQAGGTMPETSRLSILARAYGTTVDELLGSVALFSRRSEYIVGNAEPGPELSAVPLLSWVQAGPPERISEPDPAGEGEKLIYATKKVGQRAYALKIKGDSMENPGRGHTFPDGCIVIVDPDREPAPGSFVVARFDDVQEATFKQLVEDAGRRYLKPLNPRYPMIPIDGNVILCGTWIQTIIDSE
jgi:SOS-response transcriptional repressor LexA